jgi:hypothetical protein
LANFTFDPRHAGKGIVSQRGETGENRRDAKAAEVAERGEKILLSSL